MMRADVVIVGAGINGCSLAYQLAKRGMDVAVVERRIPASGATGRCGAGIRQQWSTRENALLAIRSVRMFEQLSEELGMDIGLRQGGYLVVVHDEEGMAAAERNVAMQRSLGLDVRTIDTAEMKEIVPLLDPEGIGCLGATFCPTDGHADPFKTVYAYYMAARKLGVSFHKFTEVRGVDVEDGRVQGVETTAGYIKAEWVVNAAGAWSSIISRMAGIEVPNVPVRKEAMVTEPVERAFDSMVISFRDGIYFSQMDTGQILGGIPSPEEKRGLHTEPTFGFLGHMARTMGRYAPRLRNLGIMRHWTGFYDVTPDARPVLGTTDVEGFIQCNGFSGHGFMISPMTTKLLAQLIAGEPLDVPIDDLNLRRFREGRVKGETSVAG